VQAREGWRPAGISDGFRRLVIKLRLCSGISFTQNTLQEGKVSIEIDPARSIECLPRAGHSDDRAEHRKTLSASPSCFDQQAVKLDYKSRSDTEVSKPFDRPFLSLLFHGVSGLT
jgi:hypothetical protein